MTVPMNHVIACASPKASFATTPPAAPPAAPKYGTMIPSRIFVGGIDFKTSEEDLRLFFSKFGSVRDARIIRDRAEVSKGYGFVTYDAQDSVDNALQESENLHLHGKKLNIGRAVRKQPVNTYNNDQMMNTWMLHPGGYASLTNQTGVTYFVAPTGQMPYPGYTVQNGMVAAPLTYVRSSQTSALSYNQQILNRMVPFTGTLPSYYAPASAAAQAQAQYIQPPMYYNFGGQQVIPAEHYECELTPPHQAMHEGESVGSYDGNDVQYSQKLTFGDQGLAQLTPPSTPQETTFN